MLEDYGDNIKDSGAPEMDVIQKFAYESSFR